MKAGDVIQGRGKRQYRVVRVLKNGYIEAVREDKIITITRPDTFHVVQSAGGQGGLSRES